MNLQHAEILPEQEDEIIDPRLRLQLLALRASASYAEIERSSGLWRGAISNYVGHRTYAFPKLRSAVVVFLAARLERDEEAVRSYLFPTEAGPGP